MFADLRRNPARFAALEDGVADAHDANQECRDEEDQLPAEIVKGLKKGLAALFGFFRHCRILALPIGREAASRYNGVWSGA